MQKLKWGSKSQSVSKIDTADPKIWITIDFSQLELPPQIAWGTISFSGYIRKNSHPYTRWQIEPKHGPAVINTFLFTNILTKKVVVFGPIPFKDGSNNSEQNYFSQVKDQDTVLLETVTLKFYEGQDVNTINDGNGNFSLTCKGYIGTISNLEAHHQLK